MENEMERDSLVHVGSHIWTVESRALYIALTMREHFTGNPPHRHPAIPEFRRILRGTNMD